MPVKIVSVHKDSPAATAKILPGKLLFPLIPTKFRIFWITVFMKRIKTYLLF